MEQKISVSQLYRQSLALLTDQYQMTMSYGYWKTGLAHQESVFHLFFRKKPFNGGYAISAGLETVVDYLQNFRFEESDVDYLATLKDPTDKPLFEKAFLDYLLNLRFTCDIDAVPEGTAVFPFQPLMRVTGPLIQCQLLETPLLNLMNFPSLIATKASRVCMATKGEPVLEFGLRRAQGIDGALTAARAAYIGGCDSTSNVLAGKLFGIPVKGTHSHSWVMVFDEEIESFKAFAKALPSNCVFLVDTYDSIEGVKKAIEVGKSLREEGYEMQGIRLDSGDLAYLSIESRKMLDEAGFPDAQIVASNELDEHVISALKQQGAKIAVWGVGTNLITAKDQPALDGVYKLSAIRNPGEPWKYKLKLSEQMSKISNPGVLQVKRFYNDKENVADVVYDIYHEPKKQWKAIDPFDPTRHKKLSSTYKTRDLLQPIFRKGELVYELPSLDEIRQNTQDELKMFHSGVKRFMNPHQYVTGMEESLYHIKVDLINKIRSEIPSLKNKSKES